MIDLKKIASIGSKAVKRHRLEKLQNGRPFMINSRELPALQSYREYPDGTIELVEINQAATDFRVIRKLAPEEARSIQAANGF